MGNSGQGPILTGQPQGVIAGIGITINANGTIDVNSQTVQGIMKLGQTTATANAAYNGYEWPTATGTVGQQLTIKTTGATTTLEWNDPDMIPWTAKGQLVVGTGANSQTILNSGTNGQILIVDTASASGLAYTSNYVATTSATGSANIPAGPTASQPVTPATGAFRYNSDTTSLEFYNGAAWETVASSSGTSFVEKTSNTGSAIIPAGTTAQQDASPANGYLRVNTTTGLLEFYNAGAWSNAGKTLTAGLGINITSGTTDLIKAKTPIQTGPPAAGTAALQAIDGSVYWDDTTGLMFIRYNDTATTQWVQVIPVASAPAGATGSFTSSDGKTVNVSNGIITSIV